MQITLLGTGTSSGVPVLTCECEVCSSSDPKDNRLRVSVLIQTDTQNIIIDTGPDFRQQLLKTRIKDLDAVIYTHEHKDHTAGLDDIRPFNYLRKNVDIPLYARPSVIAQLKREFHYAFEENPYPGIPKIEAIPIENKPFFIEDLEIIPVELMHHKLAVYGFRIGNFAYITDANFISEKEKQKLYNLDVLVLNALQHTPHISHFTLYEAISLAEELAPKQTYLTHISHKMGLHNEVNKTLPEHIKLGYDGLSFTV